MANLSRTLNSQLNSIRRGPQTPQWWVLFQVALGVVAFVAIAWSVMSTDTSGPQVITVQSQPAPVAPDPSTSSAPTPSGTSTPDAPSGGEVAVPTTEGSTVTLPRQALDAATLAFRGAFDPAAAAKVPMADGETYPVPAQANPSGTIGQLKVSTHTDQLLTFVATYDPDGKGGTAAQFIVWSLVPQNGGWAVTLRSA